MAIYLDANFLWPWRTFSEADRLAISIVARQLGQEVCVPSIAAREAEEDYRRSLTDALESLERAHATVERRFDTEISLVLEPRPDIESKVETWRRRLAELATVLPLEEGDAQTALEREILGEAPAKPREPNKPGRGARDAAIWLTVVRHHLRNDEEGHLLCKDKAFADGAGGLNARLELDVAEAAHQVRLYPDIATFLARLGTTTAGRRISLDELQERARPALASGLRTTMEVPLAVWDEFKDTLRYETFLMAARPLEILSQQRYEQGADAIVVVNARWELVVNCAFQERNTETPGVWSVISEIDVGGDVQVFLEERNGQPGKAEFIAAQIDSDTTLFLRDDGSIMAISPAD